MKNGFLIVALLMFSLAANATQEFVTCKEKSKTPGYKLSLRFDPNLSRAEVWKTDSKGSGSIHPYSVGKTETKTQTATQVVLQIASTEFKKPYSGKFPFTGFYEVNVKEAAGTGYSYRFGGGAYRSFHGFDADSRWDMMVYLPETAIGNAEARFPGLITIQMDLMDQGYYHIDMICDSSIID